MPKAEKGTPKDIANRAKAKGLQKLKFYCQMCSKQCRGKLFFVGCTNWRFRLFLCVRTMD